MEHPRGIPPAKREKLRSILAVTPQEDMWRPGTIAFMLCCCWEAVVSRDMTFVANASGRPLRVFYSPDRLTLDEIEIVFGTRASGSKSKGPGFSVSAETKLVMQRNTLARHICIPANDYGEILDGCAIFVTVFVEDSPNCYECLNIAHNFYIPSDRSFIITTNLNLKFQRYAANIWVDEDGYNHRR
ncbi:hypothetical protein GJAV_G00085350 [Gymnothorax javanicus]|nr:hypothetical protein GJAV_G00085350 [Gymnothorax javanicus]